MQSTFDGLYERSKANAMNGVNLYDIISSRENILLAFRSIKTNTGSKTRGADGLTIADYKIIDEDKFIEGIQNCLLNYRPSMIRRVLIPKENGKERPLGIPTMRDRLVQQMFKQVLEPIVEAKFHNHSYGFRPNRSTHHAMARSVNLVNRKLQHVIDIDVQGFFDNVNHRKLIEQLYNIGIKDKRVLTLINRMLKAEIENEGIPTKGTVQGGIISPLLANVVLNELDWWISNQWETFETRRKYGNKSNANASLKKFSKLKPMYIVRYADDFKIFTNNHVNAEKIYHATKSYLWENLHLEISPEKSSITNLRKRSSEFLGFEIRGMKKRNKYLAKTNIMKKKKDKILARGKELIKEIRKNPTPESIYKMNSWILGIHNYNRIATHVSIDFGEIDYLLNRVMYNRFKAIGKHCVPKSENKTYKKLYGGSRRKTWQIKDAHLFPISYIKNKIPINFSQEICNYTHIGRNKIFSKLGKSIESQIHLLMNAQPQNKSIEYCDNRISRYSMQNGKCAVTGQFLMVEEVHCHHVIPIKDGGKDTFDNLIIMHLDMHKVVHATDDETIRNHSVRLTNKGIDKINKLRKILGLFAITKD